MFQTTNQYTIYSIIIADVPLISMGIDLDPIQWRYVSTILLAIFCWEIP